ncbi:putative short-subunit dehydrogenase-like oxidoreductase (DUF2520 family) [Altererythrobacter atlanticus]|uniref:Rossmann-like and DUF2520 domain-containing protein n=1 Tax=Croceibacterium atlanticum TaxID=1267766 RepID=UPI0017D04C30|nr:DUF2520 domain-containing protein [Croceibacterium atlanticum]MBB5731307.1 putative short-subunit dehydrogenase-like oxidoreductase (DUF2520 family) [Croceibacterium atlanticum]
MKEKFPVGQVGIIGTGRVARALSCGLVRRGMGAPVLWGRSPDSCRAAASETGGHAEASLPALLARSDVIAIAVSDDAIAGIVRTIAQAPVQWQGKLVFHVSGGSGTNILAPLLALGAETAAIHPAMTFTGQPELESARMAGARFAITAAPEEATGRARAIVEALEGVPVMIDEDHRTLYHAALCHAANHLVTLLSGALDALRTAGVDDPASLLSPLVHAALDNVLASGFDALSGPVKRGDAGTIRDHLATLEKHAPALLPTYRAMAIATAEELARQDNEPAGTSLLLELLGGSADGSVSGLE